MAKIWDSIKLHCLAHSFTCLGNPFFRHFPAVSINSLEEYNPTDCALLGFDIYEKNKWSIASNLHRHLFILSESYSRSAIN
ncbi:hypothetical protein T03_3430 [Trichinella britovi]|uniref:Uncharacterized protein n=1 Tax=Trichinella britovi TaxID=45882 RepID=A0A0V1CQF9_TRIBR|nr:hypothetical protein T03_3430 [Trichinella britovi]KRZ90996.1 hypothetical protein T08_6348 [Trichinella sp. T8]